MTTEQKVTRKLSAILSADVKGYSLLMTNDEFTTIKTLKEYRKIMTEIVEEHSGRVVDAPGDNIMAEFSSVVNAIQCSVEIQKTLKDKNAELPDDKRLEFRIGVNIGDVVQDGENLYGEGVNIAARIEGLADPGGICISRGAYDHLKNKLKLGYEYIGEHSVKNIKDPVRVYKVLMEQKDAGKLIGKKPKSKSTKWIFSTIIVATIALTLIGYQLHQKVSAPEFEAASIEKMAFALPEEPSIAVLAFDNLSGDPEQEFLADGITEQIITGLSRMPYMFVIARNSSFTYKGKPVKIQQVAVELGVQYVLEGSVQQSGNRIRVTAQLIDALSGRHIWSERYDRVLEDIFEVQDEIMINIMRAMEVRVAGLGMIEYQSSPRSVEAYLKILKAIKLVYRWNKDDNILARKLYEEAIALDPDYGPAYELLGWTYFHEARWSWVEDPVESYAKAEELGKKAISLGGLGHMLLMSIYNFQGQTERAHAEGQKALSIHPNAADLNILFSNVLSDLGRHEEAITRAKKAIRLNPHHQPWYFFFLGICYFEAGKNEEALEVFQLFTKKSTHSWIYLASIYCQLNRDAEAKQAADEVYRIAPDFSWAKYCGEDNIFFFHDKEIKRLFFDSMQKVGLK